MTSRETTGGGRSLPLLHERAPSFDRALDEAGCGPLRRDRVTTVQINVGKLCNQACQHCHVEAGPKRTEVMDAELAARLLALIDRSRGVETVDLTGGAPELNPSFRHLVTTLRARGIEVIDRCNLTVLFEPGQEDTARFLADQGVHVIASLPCYSSRNVEDQRGKGVFDRSIRALQLLGELGYGRGDSGLVLDLVYNPVGPFLPPPQEALERDYRRELDEHFGIRFDHLFTITNMPIKRFAHALLRDGKWEEYMTLLVTSFNPATVEHLMCRWQISVGHDGQLYDCDFHQMLELAPAGDAPRTVWEVESFDELADRPIATAAHCFGCTAGAGSSCGGALE